MKEDQINQNSAAVEEAGDHELPKGWLPALVEQTLAGIYLIQDGVFRYVNQEFANIFGDDAPADIVGTLRIIDLIAPEDRARVTENIRRRAEGEVSQMRYTFTGQRRDGRRIHVEVHGRAMSFGGKPAVIGLLLDVTERKIAEAAADEKLRALFEHSPLGIALVDPQGKHLECNNAYQRIVGRSDETLRTMDTWSLIPPQFANQVASLRQSLNNVGHHDAIELEYCREDGQPVPVQVSGVRICGSGGQAYVWSIVEDITARKRLEAETAEQLRALTLLNKRLQNAQTQLLQAEKMSAVGQLAAGVAHEINNPVGFVKSNLGTLREYLAQLLRLIGAYEASLVANPDHSLAQRLRDLATEIDYAYIVDDAPQLLQESLDGIERVKRIVADLKDFSRIGEAEWQPADLHQCIDSTLNVAASKLMHKADVLKDYGAVPPIRCMPFQLNQVFLSLLINAAQAIPERGIIRIRSGREGESVWVEIEDSGSGIPADIQGRIFDPFFTTKPVGEGTGLGLAVAYGIVQSHDGEITVQSQEGVGTTFRVKLPIDPGCAHSGPRS